MKTPEKILTEQQARIETEANLQFGGDALLDTLLESDPPAFKGSVDDMHKAYAWPGRRTPIIRCLWTKKWFSTWLYHRQKLTCLCCLKPVDVEIIKEAK